MAYPVGVSRGKLTLCGRLMQIPTKHKILILVSFIVINGVVLFAHQPCFTSTSLITTDSGELTNDAVVDPPQVQQAQNVTEELHVDRALHGKHLPHFIIAGVKKAGTRALLTFLNIHPDICTTGREIHFFDRNETYAEGLELYQKMMPFTYSNQLTGEKSPGYYRTPYAPERIYRMNSTVKLIMIVREPIDRAMSNYLRQRNKQNGDPSFRDKVLTRDGEVNPKSPEIYNSDYGLFIDNWIRWFPLEQMYFVNGDELINHPPSVMVELQKFLGVQQYIDEKFFQYNKDKGFYCYFDESVSKPQPICLGESKGRKHPPIDNDIRQKLSDYFKPRNEIFFRKIKKRFNWLS